MRKINSLIVGIVLLILVMSYTASAGYLDTPYWPNELYKDGGPDYADGDLEDKLGDSGYYYDLFPEERDEPDDYNNSNSSSYSSGSSSSSNNSKITTINKYTGRWEKVNAHSIWSQNINGTYRQDYEWVFYPTGSSSKLVLKWAVIDDKLYHFDRSGYMIHNTNGWINNWNEDLYATTDGAYVKYEDYKKNGSKADTYYKNVIPSYITVK